jgi:hypothetical protein
VPARRRFTGAVFVYRHVKVTIVCVVASCAWRSRSATGAAEERARYRAGPKDDEEPHIYVTARNAHRAATQDIPNNQSIIISGESGSGKTFATKMMLKCVRWYNTARRLRW